MRFSKRIDPTEEIARQEAQLAALMAATERRLAAGAEMPGLGEIRADRTIPIKARRHSIRHKAIR